MCLCRNFHQLNELKFSGPGKNVRLALRLISQEQLQNFSCVGGGWPPVCEEACAHTRDLGSLYDCDS